MSDGLEAAAGRGKRRQRARGAPQGGACGEEEERGDRSDVGVGLLYQWMGVPLPPPFSVASAEAAYGLPPPGDVVAAGSGWAWSAAYGVGPPPQRPLWTAAQAEQLLAKSGSQVWRPRKQTTLTLFHDVSATALPAGRAPGIGMERRACAS